MSGWPIKGAIHPETRIAAKSPAMRKVVVYFVEMIAPSVDILQYFLSWYLRVLYGGLDAESGQPQLSKSTDFRLARAGCPVSPPFTKNVDGLPIFFLILFPLEIFFSGSDLEMIFDDP